MENPPSTSSNAKDSVRDLKPRATAKPTDTDEDPEDPPPGFLQTCWPVVFGVVLAIVAPRLRDMLADYEPWGMRLVFPFVLLSGRRELGLGDELSKNLPQLMLYLQFPLEGLLTMWSLGRRLAFSTCLAQLAFLHAIAAFVLWLLSQPGAAAH